MLKIISLFGMACLFLVLASCGDKTPPPDKLMKQIKTLEDSLTQNSMNDNLSVIEAQQERLADKLLLFYHAYPDHQKAPVMLERVHMLYSAMGDNALSAKYGDTLLAKYPNYPQRNMIIESQILNYDMFITPRDTAKLRYYIERYLQENPRAEEAGSLKGRLQHLELSREEWMTLQNREAEAADSLQ